ncbi:hypothetical protein McanCB56680_004255 [Microsporum canis]
MAEMYNSSLCSTRDIKKSTFYMRLARALGLEKDDDNERKCKRWLEGWRITLFMASCTGILVLSFNLGFLLWALPRHNLRNGRGVLYDGDCDRVHGLSIGLHLVINIFSTLLLSSSNYTMQCLSAPTRVDIDQAHKKLKWLDVGISSVRNFRQISWNRSALWAILVFSSLPLHLMYNSTVFATTSSNSSYVFLGDESYGLLDLEDLMLIPSSLSHTKDYYETHKKAVDSSFIQLHDMAQNRKLEKLDNTACINAYTKTYQNSYVNLLLVTEIPQNKSQYMFVDYQDVYKPVRGSPYIWICLETLGKDVIDCNSYVSTTTSQAISSNWTILSYPVKYCLAEVAQPHCKLQYSLSLIVVVMIFIMVKVATICYVAFTIDTPILTTGDAITSFIKNPDKTMRGKCLLSRGDVDELSSAYNPFWVHQSRWQFARKPKQWYSAVPAGRWCFGVISYVIHRHKIINFD